MSVDELGVDAVTAQDPARLLAALESLRAPRTLAGLADELLARQLTVTRAVAGVALVLSEDRSTLELVASSGYDPVDLEGWQRSPLSLRLPLHDAVREDRVVFVRSLAEMAERYPESRAFDDAPHALAGLPLRGASGEVIGGVGLRFDVDPLDADALLSDLSAGELLAGIAGERIEQDRLIESLRARVGQLQHALDSRVLIEQAKGVLAERHGIDPEDAFERLRAHARRHGARVHLVAADVLDGSLSL